MKKLILSLVFIATAITFITSCSKSCSGENPKVRIVNNGTAKADVQVQTTGGNTININNIQSGTSSEYSSFATGYTTFTANVGSNQKVLSDSLEACFTYDVKIDASNNIIISGIKVD